MKLSPALMKRHALILAKLTAAETKLEKRIDEANAAINRVADAETDFNNAVKEANDWIGEAHNEVEEQLSEIEGDDDRGLGHWEEVFAETDLQEISVDLPDDLEESRDVSSTVGAFEELPLKSEDAK